MTSFMMFCFATIGLTNLLVESSFFMPLREWLSRKAQCYDEVVMQSNDDKEVAWWRKLQGIEPFITNILQSRLITNILQSRLIKGVTPNIKAAIGFISALVPRIFKRFVVFAHDVLQCHQCCGTWSGFLISFLILSSDWYWILAGGCAGGFLASGTRMIFDLIISKTEFDIVIPKEEKD